MIHAPQVCKTRKIRKTLCGKVGVLYAKTCHYKGCTWRGEGRLYCKGSRERFKIAGNEDVVDCKKCLGKMKEKRVEWIKSLYFSASNSTINVTVT